MKKRIKGFTLIELLTVIAIIAILAGFTFAILPRVRERAKLRRMDNTFLQFRTAMTSYFTDHNTYPPGYGFVKWDSKDYQVGQIPDEQLFMLRPYTALLKVHGDRKYLDEFSEGFDTNRDGRIGLMEFLPMGIKSQATGVYTFPDELYRGNNNPGGELTRLMDMENRPFVYAPVNKRQFQKARRYWIENGFFYAESWDPTHPMISDLTFPASVYDAYVLISVGPGGSTAGVVPEPLGTEPPRNVYHILALRTYFLATRDLNDNGQLDFHFESRRKGEAGLEYDVEVRPGVKIHATNKLPKADEANSWGPYIFVVE